MVPGMATRYDWTGKSVMVLGVLGGAYRGRSEERGMLTHLVALDADGMPERVGCSSLTGGATDGVDRLVDPHGAGEAGSAPTCPCCLARWTKLTDTQRAWKGPE